MFATTRSCLIDLSTGFDAGALSAAEAVTALDDLNVITRAAESMRAQVMKRIADTNAWAGSGSLDAARFVAEKCALPVTEIRRTIEAEDKLEELPATAAALRSGQLSTKAAHMIANAATVNPDAERSLLGTAPHGLNRLRDACMNARAAVEDPKERAKAQKDARRHVEWTDDLGMGAGEYHIPPEVTGAFRAALKAETNRLFLEHARANHHEPLAAYAADALVNLVLGRAGRDQTDEAGAKSAPRTTYNVHVFVDYGLLTGRYNIDGAISEMPGVGPVDAEWVRSIFGDALIDFVIVNGKDVKTLTTPARRFTKAMQTVLMIQSTECIVAGCNTRDHLELDHRHEVHEGGPTRVDNGDPICPPHHDLKSKGWILGPKCPTTGKRTLRPPP